MNVGKELKQWENIFKKILKLPQESRLINGKTTDFEM